MLFSIIIPVKSINNYVRETVPHIQALKTHKWELFIIPNSIEENEWADDKRITILESGKVGPAQKRDLGAMSSNGDIVVFLDDDSYPDVNFLKIAKTYFLNSNVIAIGGPAITPKEDSFWQHVSGAVFLGKLTGGFPERYVPYGPSKEIDDWPTVNLMVRRKDFLSVGGFDCHYWPGDDTWLCLKLKKTGKKIMYAPEMIVWHHRRAGFLLHLKQVGAYGLHRGYFARHYPETSFRFKFFIPSLFVFFVLVSIIFALSGQSLFLFLFILFGWTIYILAIVSSIYDSSKHEGLLVSLATLLYLPPTHFFYGIRFMMGFLRKGELVSKLR
ncbi:glycosyltransferase [Methylophilales bacterium]|nr:glycosyltransferase [Methylophilales bacterium]